MNAWLGLVIVLFFGGWALAYLRTSLWLSTAIVAAALAAFTWLADAGIPSLVFLWLVFFAVFIPLPNGRVPKTQVPHSPWE